MTWGKACGEGSAARIAYEREFGESSRSLSGFSQEEGRPRPPTVRRLQRSRIIPTSDPSLEDEPVPVRRVLLWSIVAILIVVGIVLYFRFERQLTPIVG